MGDFEDGAYGGLDLGSGDSSTMASAESGLDLGGGDSSTEASVGSGFSIDLAGVNSATSNLTGLVSAGSGVTDDLSSLVLNGSAFGEIGSDVAAASSSMQDGLSNGLNQTMGLLGTLNTNVQASANGYDQLDSAIADSFGGISTGGSQGAEAAANDGQASGATQGWLSNLETEAENAVNVTASMGNAIVHNPGATLGFLGGAGLAALGTGGEGAGLALDATGVGAVAGVPANVVSAGAIATGTATAVGSGSYLLNQAQTTDQVTIFNTSGSGPGETGGGGTPAEGPEQAGGEPGSGTPSGELPTAGDPVDVSTGNVVLNQVDVRLAGALPLVVERAHRSGYRTGRWFGSSWMSSLDQRLQVTPAGVFFAVPDGSVLSYPHPGDDGELAWPLSGPRWALARDGEGYVVSDPHAGTVRRFGPLPGCALSAEGFGELPLLSVTSRAGHQITVEYEAGGTPVSVTHDRGYQVKVQVAAGRVTALALAGAGPQGQDLVLIRYRYDQAGNLAEVINSSGAPLRFCYDQAGRLAGWQDRNGGWYRYTYDEAGRCVRGVGPGGKLSGTFGYDRQRRITTHTDASGAVTVYQLTEGARVAAVTDPLGATTRSEYDQYGQLIARTDPLGRVTRWDFDRDGNLASITRPDGSRATAVYDGPGLPVLITGPGGETWAQEFDLRGCLTRVSGPDSAATSYSYDERGNLAAVTGPDGNVTAVVCDEAGLPVAVTAPDGGVTRYQRDAFGRVTAVTGPDGRVTRLAWTIEGRLASRVLPGGATERFSYDADGNLAELLSPVGAVTRLEYGSFDRVAARTGPDGTRTEFAYDHELRLTSVSHGRLTWRYDYDPAGRLAAQTDYNGAVTRYSYDAAGQLTAQVNAAGQRVSYAYDLLGNLTERNADGVITRFAHDAAGRLTRAASPDAVLELDRDAGGRVIAETCNGRSVYSEYDAAGRRIRRVTPSGAQTRWSYDAAGRPAALSSGGQEILFGYDHAGRETLRQLPGGVMLTQEWDPAGQLAAQVLSAAPGTSRMLQRRSYSYRADGLLAGIDDLLSGPRRLTLDSAGEVTGVTGPGWSESYGYDPAGNITTAAWPGPPAAGPAAAVPASAAGPGLAPPAASGAQGRRDYSGTLITRAGDFRYQHDRAGRIIMRQHVRLSRKPDTWRYEWDAEDRLTAVTTPDGSRWQYRYDPIGRRIAKHRLGPDGPGAEHTSFTWDGPVLAEQATAGGRGPDSGHLLTWDYQPGTFTPLTQAERWRGAPQDRVDQQFYAIVSDHLGTPAEMISSHGDLAGHQRQTLWGTTYWHGAATPLRFPGQYADPETGLNYNHHRYYDPAIGRYLTPDPLGLAPAPNPHTYVPNPTRQTDPLGLDPGGGAGGGDLPTLQIDARRMPNIANNVQSAIDGGQPDILTRTMNQSQIANNRAAATAGFTGPGSPDEYPFASTWEGGAGSQVTGVPLSEQYIQGGLLRSFYSKFGIGDGDMFQVKVIGNEP